MSKAIISVMADLIKLHQSFNQLAAQKTDIIKNNDMPALDGLLKKEIAYVRQLRKLEEDRLFCVSEYMRHKGLATEGVTMEQLIAHMPKEEQALMSKLQRALLTEIDRLRNTNELNQQLIYDSLRFVNLSLDLVAPEPGEVTYGRPNQHDGQDIDPNNRRPLFDSKA